MLYSNNHLKAEADYRREVLSRTVPLDTAESFHMQARERTVRSVPAEREPLAAKARSALGRLAEVVVAKATRAERRGNA